jgi:immunity protein 27 of polymorphic toxin system
MRLLPNETDLMGKWRLVHGTIESDSTCRRIERLIKDQLTKLGSDASGWDTLFQDPSDGRYWELTYPQSDSEGGGPPRLTCMEQDNARRKYGAIVD